jgi:hypothetical protein
LLVAGSAYRVVLTGFKHDGPHVLETNNAITIFPLIGTPRFLSLLENHLLSFPILQVVEQLPDKFDKGYDDQHDHEERDQDYLLLLLHQLGFNVPFLLGYIIGEFTDNLVGILGLFEFANYQRVLAVQNAVQTQFLSHTCSVEQIAERSSTGYKIVYFKNQIDQHVVGFRTHISIFVDFV